MFNFGSFINLSKNCLIILGVALIIYGVSLLLKLVLTKTNNSKIWENIIGKYWSIFVLIVSSVVYIILAFCKKYDSAFVNGLLNGLLLTGAQASMFKIVNAVINFFKSKIGKSENG